MGSQEVVREESIEFRIKQIMLWTCGGITLYRNCGSCWACGKTLLALKPYNLAITSFCLVYLSLSGITQGFFKKGCNMVFGWSPPVVPIAECELVRVVLQRVGRVGLVQFPR